MQLCQSSHNQTSRSYIKKQRSNFSIHTISPVPHNAQSSWMEIKFVQFCTAKRNIKFRKRAAVVSAIRGKRIQRVTFTKANAYAYHGRPPQNMECKSVRLARQPKRRLHHAHASSPVVARLANAMKITERNGYIKIFRSSETVCCCLLFDCCCSMAECNTALAKCNCLFFFFFFFLM